MTQALSQAQSHLQANRPEQALALLQRAAQKAPADPDIASLLSLVLLRLNRFEQAEHYARRAAAGDRSPLNLTNLALILGAANKNDDALAMTDEALALNPAHTDARLVRCNILMIQQRVADMIATCEEGLRHGWNSQLSVSYASALLSIGEPRRAADFLADATARFPDEASLASLLAMARTADPLATPAEVSHAHKSYGHLVNRIKPPFTATYHPKKDPEKKLRIALASPDLRRHSVAFFIEPLLEHIDTSRYEIVCYPTDRTFDEVSARFKAKAALWREAHSKIELQLAQMLSDDRIDIAVDLAGHSNGNSLLAFALRMAPVQATYCGYPDTTGLTQMDWRIVDSHTDPDTPDVNAHATERLYRLDPCFLCYRPPESAPAPTSDIRHPTSHITFGSFNASRKHNQHVADLWSRILLAVPGSRLALKSQDLSDPYLRSLLLQRFAKSNTQDRIDFLDAPASLADHLALYSKIDIALDPMPYQGTTTTCEALWMGVPVLTHAGRTHAARVGVSLLTNVGASELIATSDDDFVARAVALANAPDRLAQYRATLRTKMAASPLLDRPAFCRRMEGSFRSMWREYCNH